jgi:hypothetical protein
MDKRCSSTAAATAGAPKKAKKATATRDSDSPAIGKWDCSKFVEKDPQKAAKDGILKEDAAEVRVPRPEATPTPPTGFRVIQ